MTMLSSSSPVAATSEVGRPLDAGALEHEQLGRVAADHLVLELRLELVEPVRLLLDQRHLVAGAEQRPHQVRADLAAAGDQDVHLAPAPVILGRGRPRRASRSPPRSGRRCAGPASRRTARAPGRARGRRRSAPRSASAPPGAITRFVLSPSVVTTTASASSMPASRSSVQVHAVADDEPAGPVLAEPRRARPRSRRGR